MRFSKREQRTITQAAESAVRMFTGDQYEEFFRGYPEYLAGLDGPATEEDLRLAREFVALIKKEADQLLAA